MPLDDPKSPSEPVPSPFLFLSATGEAEWPLAAAAAPLLPSGTPEILYQGIVGSLFRSATAPAIYADLQALYLPGLAAFGIAARIDPIPNDAKEMAALPEGAGVPVFQFAGEPLREDLAENEREADAAAELDREAAVDLAEQDRSRTLIDAALLREFGPDGIVWQDASGQAHTSAPQEFRARFARAIRLTRDGGRATRRVSLVGAVQRAVIFSLAFPDRFLTDEDADAERRNAAARFLREAAGKQRDPISLRWRRAGDLLADGEIHGALDRLYDTTIRTLDLPDAVLEILTAGPGASLTNMQRRELIYLARAGNADLKVLAAPRLAGEKWSVSVRQTLDQLAASDDPLVRGAATRALSADKRG